MPNKFVSIRDAADLSGKSVQTIRRAIKSKKLKCKRQKTPQGFNYLVNGESLRAIYKLASLDPKPAAKAPATGQRSKTSKTTPDLGRTFVSKAVKNTKEVTFTVTSKDFRDFTSTLETMLSQHSEERQNFMRLINTLQEKIFVMENQLNLLKAPQKRWYQVWK